jgi:hypothetical protein
MPEVDWDTGMLLVWGWLLGVCVIIGVVHWFDPLEKEGEKEGSKRE